MISNIIAETTEDENFWLRAGEVVGLSKITISLRKWFFSEEEGETIPRTAITTWWLDNLPHSGSDLIRAINDIADRSHRGPANNVVCNEERAKDFERFPEINVTIDESVPYNSAILCYSGEKNFDRLAAYNGTKLVPHPDYKNYATVIDF